MVSDCEYGVLAVEVEITANLTWLLMIGRVKSGLLVSTFNKCNRELLNH